MRELNVRGPDMAEIYLWYVIYLHRVYRGRGENIEPATYRSFGRDRPRHVRAKRSDPAWFAGRMHELRRLDQPGYRVRT